MRYRLFVFLIGFFTFLASCTIQKQLKESPYKYGCKGDSRSNDLKGMQAFFDSNTLIEIPKGIFNVSGDLYIKGNKTLILNGTIKGGKGNERIFCDGEIKIKGKGTFQSVSLEVLGGIFQINDVKFINSGRSAAILINNDNKVIKDLIIDGIEVSNGPYGILRQGAIGEKPILKGLVQNCFIHDCRGDGIEWNVGYRDGPFSIIDNRIENLNSDFGGPVGKSWGIGIGVAGGQCNDNYENYVKDFKVLNNTILNVRHGIHIETGSNFEISDNKVVINPNQSAKGTLAVVGIVTYACSDFVISDNEVFAGSNLAIWNSFGSLPKIGYLTPPRNYIVKENKVEGVVHNWASGKGNSVEVFDNEIKGNLEHFGSGAHSIYNNRIRSSTDKPELLVNFFIKGKDKRRGYNAPVSDIVLIEKNNFLIDSEDSISKKIIK